MYKGLAYRTWNLGAYEEAGDFNERILTFLSK